MKWISENRIVEMADVELRANSLRLRFERGSPEPSDVDIFGFMKTRMGLKSEKLLSMYKDKNDVSVIIKFKTEEDMRNTLRNLPDTMEFAYSKYQSATVKLSPANAIVRYVRLFNLPPEIEDREIAAVLGKYGKIVRMVREKYGEETGYPIWTSVRGVYLELKDKVEIPALLNVRNMKARVFYEGLVNKCYQCGSAEHLKAECPQKRSVNERMANASQPSYSGIVANGNRWSKPTMQKGVTIVTSPTTTTKSAIDAVDVVGGSADTMDQQPVSSGTNTHSTEQSGENLGTLKSTEMGVVQGQRMNLRADVEQESNRTSQVARGEKAIVDGDGDAGSVVKEQAKGSGKSSSKRGHKARNKGQNTNQLSDSDNSNTDLEQQIKSSNTIGNVSDALDRITRSKTKQIKLSMSGEQASKEDPVEGTNEEEMEEISNESMSDNSI